MIRERSWSVHSASVEALARRIREELSGAGSGSAVADHLREAAHRGGPTAAGPGAGQVPGPVIAAGAVRMLGADVLAGCLLAGRPLAVEESRAVRLTVAALPPAARAPAAPPLGAERPWLRAWVDRGLVTAWARAAGTDVSVHVPTPAGPPPYDGRVRRRGHADGAGRSPDGGGGGEGWVAWSLLMGQLASLALPHLDGPVHEAARGGVLGFARGATRAMLRGDYASAARLCRWLAWLEADGVASPLDLGLLGGEIALRGGGERCLLDVAIADRMRDGERAWTRG